MKVLGYTGLQLYHELATEKFADAQTTLTNFQNINNELISIEDEHNNLSNLVGTTSVSTQISNYAPSKTGLGASGDWNINVTGSSAKVTTTATNPSSATNFYLLASRNSSTETNTIVKNSGIKVYTLWGTASTAGYAELTLGNNTASGTAGNVEGKLVLFSTGSAATILRSGATATRTLTLPDCTGTILTTGNYPALTSCTGTLTVAKGGTGLTASPSMLINLGSTSAANVFAASPRPGITGTLSISHGGTGATSALGARQGLRVFYGTLAEREAHSAQEGDIWFVTD